MGKSRFFSKTKNEINLYLLNMKKYEKNTNYFS